MSMDELIRDAEILDRIIFKSSHQVNLLELESAAAVLNRHRLSPVMPLIDARRELSGRIDRWRAALAESRNMLGLT